MKLLRSAKALAFLVLLTLMLSVTALAQGQPIQISSAEDFAGFLATVKTTPATDAVLTCDIDISEVGSLNLSSDYAGAFDGQNHCITGFNSASPLFGEIKSGATVSNLGLQGDVQGDGVSALANINNGTI